MQDAIDSLHREMAAQVSQEEKFAMVYGKGVQPRVNMSWMR